MIKLAFCTALIFGLPLAAHSQSIFFGSNESQWAHDGECDDRRFFGAGMAPGLDTDDVGRDASDCRNAFNKGQVELWTEAEARAATQCSAVDFGDDSSEWANDGECDDYRLEGRGMSGIVLSEDSKRDATDCQWLCTTGMIFLRDY